MKRIGFTTSRKPSNKTRSFIHDIIGTLPRASRIARGTQSLSFTLKTMIEKKYDLAVVINSVKGNPNFIKLYDLTSVSPIELPYAIKVRGLTLSREIVETKRKRQPNVALMISSLNNSDEEEILKKLFNTEPVDITGLGDSSFVNVFLDYIEEKGEKFIHVEFTDKEDYMVGPRMKLKVIPRVVDNKSGVQ